MNEEKPQNKKAAWEKMKTASVLAVMSVLFGFSFLHFLMFRPIPKENVEIVSILTGLFFGTLIGGVSAYFFNYKKEQKNYVDGDYHENEYCDHCGKSKTLKDELH